MTQPTYFTAQQFEFLQELNQTGGEHYAYFGGWYPGSAYCTLYYGVNHKKLTGEIQIAGREAATAAIERLRELTGRQVTHTIPERESPEREMHLKLCAEQALRCIYTWTMPADFGLNMGMPDPGGNWRTTNTSTDEILQTIIEWEPRPDFDAGEDYPEDVRRYARELWADVGVYIRNRATLMVDAPVAEAVRILCQTIYLYGTNGVPRGWINGLWEALEALDPEMHTMAGKDDRAAYIEACLRTGINPEE